MTREEAQAVIMNEQKCIDRADRCNRDCGNCDLVMDEKIINEAYNFVIKALEQPERKTGEWIPVTERLPEEDHWLGGSGRQFSDEVLVSVVNYDDEDIWTYISQTIDGEWALELPSHCKIIAWMPLPEPYTEETNAQNHN